MKTVTTILALFALCSPISAQTKPDIQLPAGTRIYEPQNLTAVKAQRVAASVQRLMGSGVLSWDEVMHAFVIQYGKPELIDMAEALLKRYDVPDPRIELTVYLIRASSASAPAVPGPSNPVPPELKPAIDEMKGTFNYDRYTLWDAIILHPKGNGGEVQGILSMDSGPKPYMYTVGYGVYGGGPTEGKTLDLASFMFSIKMPGDIESHIKTDVTIHEGQKLVLGKIRLLPSANSDLFLVLTTKID